MLQKNKGFNLIGYATSPMGLGEDLRSFAAMLDYLGVPFSVIDVPTDVQGQVNVKWNHMTTEDYDASVFFMSAVECQSLANVQPKLFSQPKTKIGYFLWELPDFPDEHVPALSLVDHIWCPTKFVQEVFFKKSGKLTLALPLPVVQHSPSGRNFRKELGIPKDAFVSLFMFDLHSTMKRKNPIACIRAFAEFAKRNRDAYLILKVSRWQNMGANALSWIPDSPKIKVIKETLKPSELTDLYLNSDCYLSLHRSEGFGRTLVEALQNGLQVVSTNFSGPKDFLNERNALLVPWTRQDIAPNEYPNQTMASWWAEPSVQDAASHLQIASERIKAGKNLHGIRDGSNFSHEALADKYKPILSTYLK
jgi:glycosyltransferase involved in cell wall biosynthesis